ncbi:Spo0E like sporulation regulatory protein [Bacillus cereus]|nr:Spo0E like sporulation regulatory protein [Bacillus cereus]
MDMRLLHDTIEDKKEELSYLVKKYGFSHQKVIDFSQKLDLLIYEAMRKYRLDQKMRIKKESLIQ